MSSPTKHIAASIPPQRMTPYLKALAKTSPAIARQFIATEAENFCSAHDQTDPIGDLTHSPVPGIIHRYKDRALILPTMACAATCRFCFRRDRLTTSTSLSPELIEHALEYITQHPEISEVILSGGDPLTLPPEKLCALLAKLNTIPTIETLRIHTRLPIVDPTRAKKIIQHIESSQLTKVCWMALHINHPDEITEDVKHIIYALRKAGIILVSQTVLLAQINDDLDILCKLFKRLVSLGVKPYYLHHLDRAVGTEHFRVPLAKGRRLAEDMRKSLSGLAQPVYILDIPGGHGKVWATDAFVTQSPEGQDWTLRTSSGEHISYPPDS